MTRSRSVSKKRSIKVKSRHGAILRQPCRDHLKGICTRQPCEYWHHPECRVVRLETSVCSRITRLTNNQTRSQRKATIPHKWRENDDNNAVATVKIVPHLVASRKTRKHGFLKKENCFGETRCKKSWDQFEGYDSQSLRYVKRVSRRRKDHRWEK